MIDLTGGSETLLGALMAAGDTVYVWDIESDRMTFMGDSGPLVGRGRIVDGAAYQAHVNAEDQALRLETLARHFSTGDRFDCEYRLRQPDGAFCWVHDRGQVENGAEGKPRSMTGTLRVVTERKSAEEGQRERASYDTLTGHYNQSRLRDALENTLSYARRYGAEGGYLVVGLDGAADIAATYSDAVVDQLVLTVGQRLEACLRTADMIGRLDTHCFGVVLSHCPQAGLAAAAAKIIGAVSSEPVSTSAGAIPVSVSIGGILFPIAATTAAGAMVSAETALEDAMRSGGGAAVLCGTGPGPTIPDTTQEDIGEALLNAMNDGRVAFAYQPVVHGNSREVAYYETLLRIVDDDKDPVPASLFVPVAEKLGHSQRVDRHVLDLAMVELETHESLHLAINISGFTVTDRSWLRRLSGLVGGRPEIARRLIVEITETAALYDFEDSLRFVSAVRALGCRVSLDDFGVGFTGFRHLQTFPVDTVKIDGSFVRGVAQNEANQEFIDTLLGMARSFGMETVAECVETQADMGFLLGRGVTYLQGWELGAPALAHPALAHSALPVNAG